MLKNDICQYLSAVFALGPRQNTLAEIFTPLEITNLNKIIVRIAQNKQIKYF
ncbi:hypothetical protein KJ575_05125 [Patescibacteria group bacterium]|nr:hypothetical protein [Patescibacteria group bacterium]MBU4369060.1 hypothetical protein [Patescibacteria group bacterium]